MHQRQSHLPKDPQYDLPGDIVNSEDSAWSISSQRVEQIDMPFEEICPRYDFSIFVIAARMNSGTAARNLCKKLGMDS